MALKEGLGDDIREYVLKGLHARTKLKTDQRVLARITDGIYRHPASALRELIFNSYDADATSVWIQTDAPRFSQIVISDDGQGMTLDVLNYVVHHIGGSSKRTPAARNLGVSSGNDQKRSPGGRKLIGKIGIGLFSVAQLTRHFQIITKPQGERYRYVADIRLNSYEDEALETHTPGGDIVAGDVEIWREGASDYGTHGTQIVLLDLKEFTRGLLQSKDRWERVVDGAGSTDELVRPEPIYHIGSVVPSSQNTRRDEPRLPWDPTKDSPRKKFERLYEAILDLVETSTSDPSVSDALDNYLNTLWLLAISCPLRYVDRHPYQLTGADGVRFFQISNRDKDSAKEIIVSNSETIGQVAGLPDPESGNPFSVFVDEIELLRPIRFTNLPSKSQATFKTPLMFVAKCHPDLKSVSAGSSGGQALAFSGYFFWTTKVVPKENNGLIVRIGNASGTVFDDTFLKYEVSEQTRLRQITAELFASEGVEAALNIDRESFNYSHPHYQFITRWVHRALRQVATRHKALGQAVAEENRKIQLKEELRNLRQVVTESLSISPEGKEEPPNVVFVEDVKSTTSKKLRREGNLVISANIFGPTGSKRPNKLKRKKDDKLREKLKAVTQILGSYGLLKDLSYEQQDDLLKAIVRVFNSGNDR